MGKSLDLTVPVATYKVSIVKAGKEKPGHFGPVSLTVKGGALNLVYAWVTRKNKTMNVRRACPHGRQNRLRQAFGGEHRNWRSGRQ